jgi:hypothetical protein
MHALPHAPQFDLSVIGLTHAPLHVVHGELHAHDEPMHVVGYVQTFPHAPQFDVSLERSAQYADAPVPHVVVGATHTAVHTPLTHDCDARQV